MMSSPVSENKNAPARAATLVRLAVIGMVWAFSIIAVYGMFVGYTAAGHIGLDAHAYWAAVQVQDPYAYAPGYQDAFLYSPAFLQAVTPLAQLPWPAFGGVWMVASTLVFWWLLRPLPWYWRVPALLMCMSEIFYGNIHALLALMICLGMKRPGFWAFAFLTKITIGLVGVVWFAARRDWKALAEMGLVTGAIVLVSMLSDYSLWTAWYDFLTTTSDGQSSVWRLMRLALVALVVTWAARTDREWILPAALLFAAPRFSLHIKDLSILAATPRLSTQNRKKSSRGISPLL